MSNPDNLARFISIIGLLVSLAGLTIATLSYRRGRPQVMIKNVCWRSKPVAGGITVEAVLANRSQAKAQLTSGVSSPDGPIIAEFQHPRDLRLLARLRPRHAAQHGRKPAQTPLIELSLPDHIDAFSAIKITGNLLDEQRIKVPPEFTAMRLQIELSSGKILYSPWFNAPPYRESEKRQGLVQLRRAFGAAIAAEMSARGLSVSSVCDESRKRGYKISRIAVNDVMRGDRIPRWEKVEVILNAINPAVTDEYLKEWRNRWLELNKSHGRHCSQQAEGS
ncbi:hypothetical protein HFP15_36905 [Amycolatopsis sp. K13G38]|uniref:Uncharacterized protein n=1 Tax=Amycolatopsis acididurans TaxID=2724524 RepID=A0ABX1JGD1_9PSEU|nr:hypothetical protein [Amycolatopsis acididurans]NKQ58444.1 hypothetical protein [Amycolatopsis acididurans]